jgi:hypothetical protein
MENTARLIDVTPEQNPQEVLVKQEALSIPEKARMIVVTDQGSFMAADTFFGVIKQTEKKIDAFFDPLIDDAMEVKRTAETARKNIVTRRDEAKAPLLEATNYLKTQLYQFTKKQEEERRLEQLRLEAQARREEEERRLKEAELLEQMGEHEEAERVIEQPMQVSAPVVPKAQAPSNFTTRENWQFEVTDIDKVPRKYLCVDDVMLRNEVKRTKGRVTIPGVRIWDVGTIATRGSR